MAAQILGGRQNITVAQAYVEMTPVDMKQERTGEFLGIQRHLTVTYIPLARPCLLKAP